MNIKTIRDNLQRTIEGKQAIYDQLYNEGHQDSTVHVTRSVLQLNLAELNAILEDIEKFIEYYAVQEQKMVALREKEIMSSWRENPDRMGGCYTEEELKRTSTW